MAAPQASFGSIVRGIRTIGPTTMARRARCGFARTLPAIGLPSPYGAGGTDQDVQASVAGLVVDVAAPPVAVIPIRDGMEK